MHFSFNFIEHKISGRMQGQIVFFLPQLVFSIYNCDSGQTDRRVAAYRFFTCSIELMFTHTRTHTHKALKKKRIGSSGSKRVTSVGSGSWRLLSDWIGRSLGLDICVQGIYSILCEIENLERMLFIFLKTWKTPRVELDVFILTESSLSQRKKPRLLLCRSCIFEALNKGLRLTRCDFTNESVTGVEKVLMYNTFTGETVRFGHETAPFLKKITIQGCARKSRFFWSEIAQTGQSYTTRGQYNSLSHK